MWCGFFAFMLKHTFYHRDMGDLHKNKINNLCNHTKIRSIGLQKAIFRLVNGIEREMVCSIPRRSSGA